MSGAWRDDSPVGRLMHDFSCTDPDQMYYDLLAGRVRYFKEDKEGVHTMCKIFEDYGKEIAREVTREVTKEKLLEHLKMLMKNLNLTVDQAMDALSVPPEDRTDVKNRIAAS